MKNILLIMPYGSVGGMERLAFTFYDFYKARGYNVKAVKIIKLPTDIIHFGEDEFYLSPHDFAAMSGVKRMLFYLKAPLMIRKIIRKEKITHSIAFGDMANVFSSLTFTGEFKIASIHALKSVEFSKPSFLNRVFRFAFKTSYVFFDKVVCISEAIKVDLIKNCGFKFVEKLKVIYNPHNFASIKKMALEPLDIKSENELFDKNSILFLGRLSIQKAPWHLIQAFNLLPGNENIRLVFIGDGDENVINYLNKLVSNLQLENRVVFLGRKSNPYRYLSKASVLALTSNYEGTPNVIIEAMSLGVPVVSSNCTDGIIELMKISKFQQNGPIIETEGGLITPNFFKGELKIPDNDEVSFEEKVFSEALGLVLSDNRFKDSLLANQDVLLEKFDFEKVSLQYLEG